MFTRWILASGLMVGLGLGSVAAAAQTDAEDDDFPPGLLARYSAGGSQVSRVDTALAFVWDAAAPAEGLPTGEFTASWTGRLLVREAGSYRFHAYVQGRVSVEFDGRTVLEGDRASPAWVTGSAVAVSLGEKPLNVTYHRTGRSGQLRLFWSSDRFPLEPIPEYLLFRAEPAPALARFERGRRLFEAYRCNACHRPDSRASAPAGKDVRTAAVDLLPAPSLEHLPSGVNPEWFVEKLQETTDRTPHEKMPAFGFSRGEAEAIAAFLIHQSQPVSLSEPKTVKQPDTSRAHGEVLLHSLGCLGCHTWNGLGNAGPYTGGELADVGRKRSRAWLEMWLKDPARLNRDHRMPVFPLSEEERTQLALALVGRPQPEITRPRPPSSTPERLARLVEQGRKLVESARCAACHRIRGVEANLRGVPELSPPAEWSASCLDARPSRDAARPGYPQADRDALIAYLTNSRLATAEARSLFEQGRRVLETRNCLGCHERGLSRGIVETAGRVAQSFEPLRGESQALIPPALTAVGDKLHDEALLEAVAGAPQPPRMPWLRIRMPRFQHTDLDRRGLAAYLIGQDRIPDDPGNSPGGADSSGAVAAGVAPPPDESRWLVAGHELVGPRGFSCIACHAAGTYQPKNVALGTRGSDLLQLGRRMRRDYFLRWTRSPLRIIPGVEMPSYVKPAPGILDESLDAQLAAVWLALNDHRFTVPTNPTAVEQYVVVRPGEPTRIIRDVFTTPDGERAVARAFAVGLDNGHNVLWDLDTFSLAQWTIGDFARQRAIGKSWYWDMAGVQVMPGLEPLAGWALVPAGADAPLVWPLRESGLSGRLLEYAHVGRGAEFRYIVRFSIDGRQEELRVKEQIKPLETDGSGPGGWTRTIHASGVSPAHDLLLSLPQPKSTLGDAAVRLPHGATRLHVQAEGRSHHFARFKPDARNAAVTARLDHVCRVSPSAVEPKLIPEPPAQTQGRITSVPGFDGVRLPLRPSIMPTAITWTSDGTLAFTSLKGHVYLARDTDGDGVEDSLSVYEEGLAAPYGLTAHGDGLIVAHKPELLWLRDTDGDGRADRREVLATGWGYTDNYHDWTCGIVRDSEGNLYVGLGSDYAQPSRPRELRLHRGTLLKVSPDGTITPIARALRYPTGLAFDAAGRLFVSDQQGEGNTFNEINLIQPGRHYGVPSRDDLEDFPRAVHVPAAIHIPHPWTRSVNGIVILPPEWKPAELAGHGIGCEYNGRFLMRFTYEQVGDLLQGAAYEFSQPGRTDAENFLGPLAVAVSAAGDIYVGSIDDSGWNGGRNTGEIVRLRGAGPLPPGIRETRAAPGGFELSFTQPVDADVAASPRSYRVSGYQRVWKGGYATPDTNRHALEVQSVTLSSDGRSARLRIDGLREGYVYEVTCSAIGPGKSPLWPATAHYTLHRKVPSSVER